MQSCVQRSAGIVVVSLLLLAGVANGERLRGVCKEGCLELSDQQSCEAEQSQIPARDNLPQVETNVSSSYRPKCLSCITSNCLAPNSSSPEMNIELQHYNCREFGIAVTWKFPENVMKNVTALYVILSERVSETCRDIQRYYKSLIPPFHHQCVSFNSDSEEVVRFIYQYKKGNSPDRFKPHLYVKLIAYYQDGCNTTTTEMVTVPQNCHTVLPGNCSVCGQNNESIPSPGGISVNPCQRMNDSMWEVLISWDISTYPCEHCIYYLVLLNEHDQRVAQLKVVGERANVTLQDIPTQQMYSVQLQLYECRCINSSNTVPLFLGSALHPTPCTQLNPSLMSTSIRMVENSTQESSLCPTTSSPPSQMTSIQLMQNSTPSPTLTPTSLANTDGTVQFVAIFTPLVGLMIVMVITIAVFAVVVHMKHRRLKGLRLSRQNSVKHELESQSAKLDTFHTQVRGFPPVPQTQEDSASDHDNVSNRDNESLLTGSTTAENLQALIQSLASMTPEALQNLPADVNLLQAVLSYLSNKTDSQKHKTVLVVYSSLTPENQKRSILKFMAQLCYYHGIGVVFLQQGLCRTSILQWIEQQAAECDAVICIFNAQFRHEWDGTLYCSNSPVRFMRNIVDGYISMAKQKKLSKYVFMVMQPSDMQKYIPDYLGTYKIIHYPLDSKTAVENVVCFIKNIPRYQFKCRSTNS